MDDDERLVVLEIKVEQGARKSDVLSDQLAELDGRFVSLETQFSRFDERLQAVDKRLGGVDVDLKVLTTKVDSNFKWLVGINVTMWATTVAGIIVVAGLILAR